MLKKKKKKYRYLFNYINFRNKIKINKLLLKQII